MAERKRSPRRLRIAWRGPAAAPRRGWESLRVPGKLALEAPIRRRCRVAVTA